MYQKLNDYFKKASYLAEKATFNDLTSKKISKKVVTPKKKLIRLKEKFMWKLLESLSFVPTKKKHRESTNLSKAFDTVNHSILLHKLEHIGIRGVVIEWFNNYLSNRKQVVKYKTSLSQGSVLGPLLFLIHVNDITNSCQILSSILSADDTNLFLSDKDIGNLYKTINQELKQVNLWLTANKLSLNVYMTQFMIFKSKKRKLSHGEKMILNDHLVKK